MSRNALDEEIRANPLSHKAPSTKFCKLVFFLHVHAETCGEAAETLVYP